MKKSSFSRLKKGVLISIIVLILAIIVCLLCLCYQAIVSLRNGSGTVPASKPPISEVLEPTGDELAGASFFLPSNLSFGKILPYTTFVDQTGQPVNISEKYSGKKVVLMYWGSWCPYCEKQLEHLREFQETVNSFGNIQLILINKTDSSKNETIEKAEAYLYEKGWQQEHLYDVDLNAYHAFGVKRIPTTIILDEEGYVRTMSSDVLESGDALEALLLESRYGHALPLISFLHEKMSDEDGGVYVSYREGHASSPSGNDVLSESMGLLMKCAAEIDDQELFDQSWSYLIENMRRNGLFSWYVTQDGNAANANSLLDDLRIAEALAIADQKWGGYSDQCQLLATQILIKNNYQGKLSSFYDFSQKLSGSSISLSYADFSALETLSSFVPEFAQKAEELKVIVNNGYISDSFPLYYSSYDYQEQSYSTDDLHTAEALITLLHLTQADMIRPTSVEWLRNALLTNTLASRYCTDGKPVPGYSFDSTAVYAIAALIGQELGDAEIYQAALSKMEQARVTDLENPLYGAFTYSEGGDDISSFDLLTPLLVYVNSHNAKF